MASCRIWTCRHGIKTYGLTVGTGDAEAIPQPAASLIEELVTGAWADIPEAGQMAEQAVATHSQRADDYK